MNKQIGLNRFSLLVMLSALFSAGVIAQKPAQANIVPQQLEPKVVVKVQPRYPVQAAYDGVQGFVELQFNVEQDGSTSNIKVVNAKPKRVFEEEAIRALSKWKYQPADSAAANQDVIVKLEFSFDVKTASINN